MRARKAKLPDMDADIPGGPNGETKPADPPVRAELFPQNAAARLKAILDALPDILFVVDREGRIYDYYAPQPELLYVPPEKFLGRKMEDLLPPASAAAIRAAIEDAVAHGHHRGSRYSLPTPNGTERWFEISVAVQGDPKTPEGRLVFLARDVTDRQRAEAALRESEHTYRLLTEGMKDVVWALDVEARRFTYVSPSVEKLRGYTPEEILARPLEEAWAPEERDRLAEFTRQAAADFLAGKIGEDSYVTYEMLQPHKDGSSVPSEVVARLVRNKQTGRLEAHGVTRDVAERKRAEIALQNSEARFSETARQTRTFVWEIDADGLYMFVTPVVEDVLGYRPDEIAGQLHFYDLHPAAGREEYKAAVLAEARQGREFRNLENPMVTKDGRTIWVSTNAFPLRGADGTLLGYRGSDMDITARKQAENALRESEARFAAATQASRSYVWQVDPEGLITYISPMVEEVLGRLPEEIVGQLHFYDLLPPEDREEVKKFGAALMARRETIRGFENRNVARDGRIVWVSSSARPLFNADGTYRGYQGIDTDITERKQAQEALRESEARARAIHDNLPGGLVYQVDSGEDGQRRDVTFMSKGAERLHGVPAEEIMRDSSVFYRQFVAEDLPRVAQLETQAIATMTPFQAEARIRLPSGEIRWRLFASAPRRLPNGHLLWDGIELDVTERKQAEEALKASETRYRELFDFAVDGILLGAASELISDANACMCALAGRTRRELVGMRISDLFAPETLDKTPIRFDLVHQGETVTRVRKLIRPDASEVFVEMHSKQMPDGTYQSIFHDITKRKQAEEALQHSEAKYRQLYEAMRDPFARSDLQGRILDINPAFEELLGFSSAELVGKSFRAITPRKWHASEKKIVAEQVRKRGFSAVYEKEYVRKDGSIVPVELRTMLICDAAGKPTGMSAVVRDVTERKRAEQTLRKAHDELERRVRERTAELESSRTALAQSEEQFRQMAENVQDAFWLIDARTQKVLYVSPAFERIWNQPFTLDLSRWFAQIHPEDRDRIVRAFRHGMKHGIPAMVTYRLLWPDGSIRWIESYGTMIRDARGRPLRAAGLHRDVTERRRLEEEILKAAESERQRIGRDLHDSLGQSLTAIGYLADAVREDLARAKRPEAADVKKLGRLIGQTAAEAHALARGLLLADLKRGGLGAALQELAFRTQEHFGGVCRYSGPASLPPLDANVAGQLYRIAQEAVTNAAKHGKAPRIDVRLAKKRGGLLLSVRDSGPGISLRRRKRAGMGLDIMRYRAGMIGATLEVDSARNHGTAVNCLLPLAPPAQKGKK